MCRFFQYLTFINSMLSGKEVLEKVLEHIGLTPAAVSRIKGLAGELASFFFAVNNFQRFQEHPIEKICIFEVLTFNY